MAKNAQGWILTVAGMTVLALGAMGTAVLLGHYHHPSREYPLLVMRGQHLGAESSATNGTHGRLAHARQDDRLVQQARRFARHLNPPAPQPMKSPPVATSSRSRPSSTLSRVQPPRVVARFELLGTSYYANLPQTSMAYISEPGQSPRWVGVGAQLGHVVVKSIGPGALIYSDGQVRHEMWVRSAEGKPTPMVRKYRPVTTELKDGSSVRTLAKVSFDLEENDLLQNHEGKN